MTRSAPKTSNRQHTVRRRAAFAATSAVFAAGSLLFASGVSGKAITLKGAVPEREIGPVSQSGFYRLIESAKNAKIGHLRIFDIKGVDATRSGIRIRGQVDRVEMQNVDISHAAEPNKRPDLPIGIHLQNGNVISIERASLSGFQMDVGADEYANGDGIAAERGVNTLILRDISVRDNSDGGFDLKAKSTRGDNLFASGNGRNYRIWDRTKFTAGTLESVTPYVRSGNSGSAHFWVKGNDAGPPSITIDHLVVRSDNTAPIFWVQDGGANIRIGRCTLDVPNGTTFVRGGSKNINVKAGPGCST